jgi:hypothetical protein
MTTTPDEELTPEERRRRGEAFAEEVAARLTRLVNTDPELRALVGLPAKDPTTRHRRKRDPVDPLRSRRPKPQK